MKKTRLGSLALVVVSTATACVLGHDEPEAVSDSALAGGESHPYQSRLVCDRAPGSTLVGRMYELASNSTSRVKIAEFSSGGNVGACELAIRASRNNKVCVPTGYSQYTVRDLVTKTNAGSYASLSACTTVTRGAPVLRTDPGYVDFIAPAELATFRNALPTLADATLDQAIKSTRTMWYDEASLAFVYQDSFGNPKGLRANRVGYDVGSNSNVPDIFALTEYFEPGKFKFPFALAAGSTFRDNIYVLNFWQPPASTTTAAGVKPVRIWKNNSHYQWVFPVGTVIGEALFIQAPDDKQWFAFEVRARVRALTGWVTSVFRPYVHASDLATAIKAKRPSWSATPDLKSLVDHVESTESLTPHTLSAPSYAALFPPIVGAMDYLPSTTDSQLIKELLTGKPFDSAMGEHWKMNGSGTLKSYAASTHASFHVVPPEYPAGMLQLSETACRRCHEQTSRPLNNLDSRVVLYGEVWGEDEIFTWHPFAIDADTFSVADNNRHINARLVTAGLIEMSSSGAPASDPQTYKVLPKPYTPTYE